MKKKESLLINNDNIKENLTKKKVTQMLVIKNSLIEVYEIQLFLEYRLNVFSQQSCMYVCVLIYSQFKVLTLQGVFP